MKANLEGRDLYAFTRHTHETLARAVAMVHPDNVDAQIGHAGAGVGEKFYLDRDYLVPAESSHAVYSLIVAMPGKTSTPGGDHCNIASSASTQTESDSRGEVVGEVIEEMGAQKRTRRSRKSLRGNGAISGIRTQDLCFTKT